jgi:hypothetical protein
MTVFKVVFVANPGGTSSEASIALDRSCRGDLRRSDPGGGSSTSSTQFLRDLIPGGASTALGATDASALLRSVRPETAEERIRKELARELIVEVRSVDGQPR